MSDGMLELLDSLADSPWAEQLTIGSDETADGTPTAVASKVLRWAVAEIATLRLTDAEREAVADCYEWAMTADHRSLAATLRGLLERHAKGGEK